jgi:phage baseplate assembly protein W
VEINEELARSIQKYEPRVTLISIESDVVDRVGISLKIAYYAQNSPVPQTLETVISRTR